MKERMERVFSLTLGVLLVLSMIHVARGARCLQAEEMWSAPRTLEKTSLSSKSAW